MVGKGCGFRVEVVFGCNPFSYGIGEEDVKKAPLSS